MLDRAPITRNGKLSCSVQQCVVIWVDTFSSFNYVNCGDSCQDHETLNTPCSHYYCGDCLVALAEAFARDKSLLPLRCCQNPFPIEEVLPNLSLELRTLFQRKHAEFSILPQNRLYCSNSTCSTFLGSSEDLHSKIECICCLVDTCPQCKEPAHPAEGCEVNASYKTTREEANMSRLSRSRGTRHGMLPWDLSVQDPISLFVCCTLKESWLCPVERKTIVLQPQRSKGLKMKWVKRQLQDGSSRLG